MGHRLDPLLRPQSVALVGASAREGSVGALTLANLKRGGFQGEIYLINPRQQEIDGLPCYASLADVPGPIDHVYIGLSNSRLEAAVDDVIAVGARACTIISTTVLADDSSPSLRDRIEAKLDDAGILCCGGNGMGFYNFNDGVWLTGFETRDHSSQGNVALISQSGSGMCGIVDVEARIDFSLAVSTGQELTVTIDQYLDFALEQKGTRVVGLFVETFRNPEGIRAALEKASQKRIPIVAIKVGRTEFSARMALSHSGALVGSDAAYEALFERYGVLRVDDLDELATTLMMFAQPGVIGAGGLVTLHDSGGERQLLIDMADKHATPLTELNNNTLAALVPLLDPGLPAVNPLDNWADGGEDFDAKAAEMFAYMLDDPGAALGAVVQARTADSRICPEYLDYLRRGQARTGKPVFLVSGRQGSGSDPLSVTATREGIPVLDGVQPFLKGVNHLLAYRDHLARTNLSPDTEFSKIAAHWQDRLQNKNPLSEPEGLSLLRDFGIPVPQFAVASDEFEAVNHANDIGYPVALKIADPNIPHKSDVGGVVLNLNSEQEFRAAYRDLSKRLGSAVMITEMVSQPGVEMILGMTTDDQFGPIVTIGIGGTLVEIFDDAQHLLPPFDLATAKRAVGRLNHKAIFGEVRGRSAVDVDTFCKVAAQFSEMVYHLNDRLQETDINPLKVYADGAIALDSLVIPAVKEGSSP